MQLVTCGSFISDELCACFLVYHLYLTHLYLPYKTANQRDVFSQSSDLGSIFCLIALCSFLWCTFTLLHFAILHCLTLQSYHLYLLHHAQRQSLAPLLHPWYQSIWMLNGWSSYFTMSGLGSPHLMWHTVLRPSTKNYLHTTLFTGRCPWCKT